jgi:hypothetical protein
VSFVYFTDRDLGLRFPEILRDAGFAVERHRDHFAHDAPDEEWPRIPPRRDESSAGIQSKEKLDLAED